MSVPVPAAAFQSASLYVGDLNNEVRRIYFDLQLLELL